jgi:glycosyltransferase involved in cell wall biosynthesis
MRLLMVGHWLRDVKVALTAFQMLRASEFDFELRIISPRFNASVADEKIVLLKGLSDEELREEYRSADILYLPLEDATANNAVLEAMACALPVVSTRVGGVPEAVGPHAGLLCESGDAQAFARSVLELARSAELRMRCGAAGRIQAEALSWRRIASMHDDFYRALREARP